MDSGDFYIFKGKCIITMSVFLFLLSIGLMAGSTLSFERGFDAVEVDVKKMATASIAKKLGLVDNTKKIIEVESDKELLLNNTGVVTNVSMNSLPIWYLPTEYGIITTYPNYYHVAYDITSPRGSSEIIYPVANGVISNIYTDSAGALIVVVRHIIDGHYYSSQYVHLSRYANIYIGEEVTPFTPLGWMGTTGYSTGVHLHFALLDCDMFGNTDMCSDLNGFFQYGRIRYNQGFIGLGNVINVPYSWTSR